MGFWNKLGKIGLQIAPYVAAPFTGGASLAFAPATRQLGQKWAEHDAQKAYEKGLGPSKFDKVLGAASEYGGMASGMGGLGKFGSAHYAKGGGGGFDSRQLPQFGRGGDEDGRYGFNGGREFGFGKDEGFYTPGGGGRGGGWQDMLGQILNRGGGNRDSSGGIWENPQGGGSRIRIPRYGEGTGSASRTSNDFGRGDDGMSRFSRRMQRQLGPVMGRSDQSNPNLALSIGAGRMDAMSNQPWRGGYDQITGYGPEPENDEDGNVGAPIYGRSDPIYPNAGGQRRRYMN